MELVKCEECEKQFNESELENIHNQNYCHECVANLWVKCGTCGEWCFKDDAVNFDNEYWCETCSRDLCRCCQCDEYIYRNDVTWQHDEAYCENCYDPDYREDEEVSVSCYGIAFEKACSDTLKENQFKNFCGVEIETINNDFYNNELSQNECEEYQFNQKDDGSLGSNGAEFSSNPANGDLLFNRIRKLCRLLNERQYYVNADCGLHIHIAISRQLNYLKKVFAFYKKYEALFFQMLPQSRQHNTYCRKLSDIYANLKMQDVLKLSNCFEFAEKLYEVKGRRRVKSCRRYQGHGKRYGWLNFHSLLHRGTLEIRAHSGTINSQKIINWLKIHLTCLDFIKKLSLDTIRRLPENKAFFLSLFDNKLQYYIKKRWSKFSKADAHTTEPSLVTRETPIPDIHPVVVPVPEVTL